MAFFVRFFLQELVQEAVEVVAVATVVTVGATATYATYRAVESLGESRSSSSGFYLERKTLWDWWLNGITSYERQRLIGLGHNDNDGCFTLQELKNKIYHADKEPGVPTKEDGYEPPSNWDGKLRKVGNSQKKGYPHKNGEVWVPTGKGTDNVKPHGKPHWDVQSRDGRSYRNVYPKKQ
jgi:hypothetical protein